MTDAMLWWVVAGAAVALELATGTFYLLMLALGLSAGAIAAHLGLGTEAELVAAALVGGGAVAACYLVRSRLPAEAPAAKNRDMNLDIGERVQVQQWNSDGTARIHYRGAAWSARYVGDGEPAPGEHFIQAIEGNQLLLGR